MRTKLDPDDEFFIPDVSALDWSNARIGPGRKPGERHEVCIDGAVGYQLRLIPSNKVLARFTSTLEAWPAIIDTVDGCRSPRTLSLDWIDAAGCAGSISAGPRLESWARLNNGGRHPFGERRPRREAGSSRSRNSAVIGG